MLSKSMFYLCITYWFLIVWGYPVPNEKNVLEQNHNYPDYSILFKSKRSIARRNRQWKNNSVPFQISDKFNETEQSMIINVMKTIEHNVSGCVQFRPKTSDDNIYLRIEMDEDCSSTIGQVFEPVMLLNESCFTKQRVLHELMHVLGFEHEHARSDRDEYIRILPENIEPGTEGRYNKLSWVDGDTLDLPYDYTSIMHYSRYTHKNYSAPPRMIPIKNLSAAIGQQQVLSSIDIKAIRRYYKCEAYRPDYIFSIYVILMKPAVIVFTIVVIVLLCSYCTWRRCCSNAERSGWAPVPTVV